MKHAGSIASCFSSYTRTIVVQEQNVLDALRRVIDPATKRDIVSLGAVQVRKPREAHVYSRE
jgi:metal-sulfur cluster biosynthetic enzyme